MHWFTVNLFLKARMTNPYIGQAYSGDGGSKAGLMGWAAGMESSSARVRRVFVVRQMCLLIDERLWCLNACIKIARSNKYLKV